MLGISAEAARMLAKGGRLAASNAYGDRARVLLPDNAVVQPRPTTERGTFADHMIADPNGRDRVNVRALERTIEALHEQLMVANGRVDRVDLRIDEPLVALADARTAAMILGSEAAALRARRVCCPRAGPGGGAGFAEGSRMAWSLRHPRAFWISVCNVIGLLFSMAGVVLLFWSRCQTQGREHRAF